MLTSPQCHSHSVDQSLGTQLSESVTGDSSISINARPDWVFALKWHCVGLGFYCSQMSLQEVWVFYEWLDRWMHWNWHLQNWCYISWEFEIKQLSFNTKLSIRCTEISLCGVSSEQVYIRAWYYPIAVKLYHHFIVNMLEIIFHWKCLALDQVRFFISLTIIYDNFSLDSLRSIIKEL